LAKRQTSREKKKVKQGGGHTVKKQTSPPSWRRTGAPATTKHATKELGRRLHRRIQKKQAFKTKVEGRGRKILRDKGVETKIKE